jgi:hypothetical protein
MQGTMVSTLSYLFNNPGATLTGLSPHNNSFPGGDLFNLKLTFKNH